MIIVVEYSHGDGCTYSCDETFTMEAESVDDAKLLLMEACDSALRNGKSEIHFKDSCGDDRYVDINDLYYANVWLLEEWAVETMRSLTFGKDRP